MKKLLIIIMEGIIYFIVVAAVLFCSNKLGFIDMLVSGLGVVSAIGWFIRKVIMSAEEKYKN